MKKLSNIKKKSILALLCFFIINAFILSGQKFDPNWDSLRDNYDCPKWFQDAKFGIFLHWGIVSAIDENREYKGSHYARYMYGPGEFPPEHGNSEIARDLLEWHSSHYGNPDDFGYKDLIPLFKAENWEPDSLVRFFKKIGAKYIVPVAVHHDNFDLYASEINRWNSYEMGPKKDIIQGWKEAAEKNELRFGVSSHLDRAPSFLQTSRKFDGGDPEYADFYLSNYSINFEEDENWMNVWYNRTMELINKYKPDLLYFDGGLPGNRGNMNYGLELAAHFYNSNIERHGGNLEAVLNLKSGPYRGAFVWDIERGHSDVLQKYPWQTDTDLSGGLWFYRNTEPVFTSEVLIGNLIDIVSKNGNLLLNVALRGDGTLPVKQVEVLREAGVWLEINGEGIYGSRPWLVYGEGPTKLASGFNREQRIPYTENDIRFTINNGYLYAFVLRIPESVVKIKSLSNILTLVNTIENVELLGYDKKINWERTSESLNIYLPEKLQGKNALTFRIKVDDKSREMW